MLDLGQSAVPVCEGLSRREWLRAGGLSALGLGLGDLLASRAAAAAAPAPTRSFGGARSCIVAFLFGAPAHQDLWDLKPEAPAEYRGEFRPIETSVSGIRVGEHLPRTARQAHRYAILRSVTHPDDTHTVAMHYMLTGTRHRAPSTNPQNQPSDFPCYGAVLQHLRPPLGGVPSGISLNSPANQVSANNHIFPGFFAGWLGRGNDPVFVADDPAQAAFRPFHLPSELSPARLLRRRALVEEVDRRRQLLEAVGPARELSRHQREAFDLLVSPRAREAFDLGRESPATRERYGRSAFGQGLLLARRLVEAGTRLVTVNWARDDAFWDTHANNFSQLKSSLLPPFDAGFSALLEDLHQRGLLDSTLVVCLGEFGRTPTINKAAGRDHWAACNSVVLAGGGVRGGQVYGASDRIAGQPVDSPVRPEDLAATLYHALGIPPQTELTDPLGRPVPLTTGEPVLPLFG